MTSLLSGPRVISGVLALIGFVVGAWLGTRLAPLVLSGGRESTWAPAFALILPGNQPIVTASPAPEQIAVH